MAQQHRAAMESIGQTTDLLRQVVETQKDWKQRQDYMLALFQQAFGSVSNGFAHLRMQQTTEQALPLVGPSPMPTIAMPTIAPTMTQQTAHHRLHPKHENLQSVYNEWYGLGRFLNLPISGGIDACEKKYGTKWRNKNSKHRISRQKRICMAIQKKVDDGKTVDLACSEWDAIYINDCNNSLENMVKKLQEMVILPKSANRGRGTN